MLKCICEETKSVISTGDSLAGFSGSITCPLKMMHDEWILAAHILHPHLVLFMLLMLLGFVVIQLITLSVLTSEDLCGKSHYSSQLILNLWEMHVL